LAKEISKKYQIPCYEKDNVVWERTPNGDKKRPPKERDRIFNTSKQAMQFIEEVF
jgi:hypothetical protein